MSQFLLKQCDIFLFLTHINAFPTAGCVCICGYGVCVTTQKISSFIETNASWDCFPSNQPIPCPLNVAPPSHLGVWETPSSGTDFPKSCEWKWNWYKCYLRSHGHLLPSVHFLELALSFFVPSRNWVCIDLMNAIRVGVPWYLISSAWTSPSWWWVLEDSQVSPTTLLSPGV